MIKCLNAWTFTSKEKSQIIPLYVDRKLYDVSIEIPQESRDWLANDNGHAGKQVGYLNTIANKDDLLETGSYSNSGGFYLSVKKNSTGIFRQAKVLIKAQAKDQYSESFTKVILVRQLTRNEEASDNGAGLIQYPQMPSNTWLWPVPANPKVGQLFGRYNTLADFHPAIDIAHGGTKIDVPIIAAKGGVIVDVQSKGSNGGTPCRVMIRHIIGSDVYYSLYLHLKNESIPKELRKIGAEVKDGDFIGYIGDTGKSYGRHLHYSLFMEVGSANMTDEKPDPNKHDKPGIVFVMNTQSVFDGRIKPNDVYKNLSYSDEGIYYKLPELK